MIVDPTGEIAGSGDACHPAVGRSWKEAAYSEKDREGKGKKAERQLGMRARHFKSGMAASRRGCFCCRN